MNTSLGKALKASISHVYIQGFGENRQPPWREAAGEVVSSGVTLPDSTLQDMRYLMTSLKGHERLFPTDPEGKGTKSCRRRRVEG